jgi:hypothetical protein
MNDERGREGNGAVVAIVVVLGILCLLGVVVIVFGAGLFWVRSAPMAMPPPTVATPAPVSQLSAVSADSSAKGGGELQIEVNAGDQILVNGELKTVEELMQTFKEIKNGNSLFTEIKIKFADSSDAKMQEVFALLKEACILYAVDPTGKVPAETTVP